jgi:hypothetical protein
MVMFLKCFLSTFLFISIIYFSFGQLYAQEEEGEIIIISERIGKEIDPEENNKFKLFEGINGFQSAVYIKLPDGKYFLKITYRDDKTGEIKISRVLQSEASIKNRGDYIDRFEEIQAEIHQYQKLSKPQTVSSDSGKIQAPQDTVYQAPGIAFFLELGGKLWYSLNVDYRRNKSEAMSLGIQWIGNGFFPYLMYYRFRGETYRSEIGGGFSGVVTDDGLMAVAIHGVLGYRYQKKNGLLFRIGFTPFIGIPLTREGRFMIVPWAGISVGYSL